MKASVVMGILAFVVLGFPTSADAHKLKQVRRELMLKGYDQIDSRGPRPRTRSMPVVEASASTCTSIGTARSL